MKVFRISLNVFAAALAALCLSLLLPAQGPINTGGPTVARPKQSSETQKQKEEEQAPIESEFKPDVNAPKSEITLRVDAPTVTVEVSVVDEQGRFINNIPPQDFYLEEDGKPQKVTNVSLTEAPLTVALVIEFNQLYQQFYSQTWQQTLTAAYTFAQTLRPDDFVAVVAYDLRPEILSDFSNNRQETAAALSRLKIPAYSEAVLYDALTFTAERMEDIEGRKAIILISTGVDTISHQNFGQARKRLQNAGVPIYAIGMMQAVRAMMYGAMSNQTNMYYMMADNQVKTFAKETGGMAFFPRFYGEFPGIMQTISDALRQQYVLTYQPTNQKRDGKFREIEVKLKNPENGKNLEIRVNGKKVKYDVIAKKGYQAPHEVE